MNRTTSKSFHINTPRLILICTLVASLALFASPQVANAANYTVTKTGDTNDGACDRDCSLREALAAANARPDRNSIRIPAGTYTLTLGQLEIGSELRLGGAGAGTTIVDGGGSGGVLAILAGNVLINDLTIQNGNANESSGIENFGTLRLQNVAVRSNIAGEDGAGIRNSGQMSISDSFITDNRAETGGGIFNRGEMTITGGMIGGNSAWFGAGIRNSGTLRLRKVTIADNMAGDASVSGSGGGIFNEDEGTIDLHDVVVENNTANSTSTEQGAGGGILNRGTATVRSSHLQDNTAALGGGLRNIGRLALRGSTVGGNMAQYGSGLHNSGGLDVMDSDIHNNRDAFFVGGGVYNDGLLRMAHSTIRDNAAAEGAGGVYNIGTAALTDTIVRDNVAVDGFGGGIDNRNTLTMRGGAVRGNTSRGLDRGGGGIDNHGTLTLRDITISGNRTNEFGGGLYSSGIADLANVVVEHNIADLENDSSGDGGGIYNSAKLSLVRSAIISNTAALGGGIGNRGELMLAVVELAGNSAAVDGGGIYNGGTLTLRDTTLSANRANAGGDTFGDGGGLFNTASATASLSHGIVRNNTIAPGAAAGSGGGIYNQGTLTLRRSQIHTNLATRNAGGIDNFGTALLANSTVLANATADGHGGGISNAGELTLVDSTLSGNTATEDGGGGLYNAARVTISGSTIGGNSGTENGGGIYNTSSGAATLTNSTVSGNSAVDMGGGIFNLGGAVSLNHVTITLNRADSNADEFGVGGGIFNGVLDDVPGTITLKNTVLAGNLDTTGDGPDCQGTFRSLGHNLIQNTFDCVFSSDTADDIVGQDARLGPLADNGGSTLTHALLDGSSAIDDVSLDACIDQDGNPIATDQRGILRPQGAACDIGAYER
jgi:fibronectin-binding autotransporter adhesin